MDMPSRPFFETGSLAIFQGDVRTTRALQPGSVDLIVTSPPYNVDIAYGKHNDGESYASYREFSRKWLERCFEWLRDDGRLCLNIPLDKNKDGQQSVGADLTGIAKAAGFQYHSTIIWNEGNISRRTAWGSWMSASAPYVIAPVELIVVLYREKWKRGSQRTVDDHAPGVHGLDKRPVDLQRRKQEAHGPSRAISAGAAAAMHQAFQLSSVTRCWTPSWAAAPRSWRRRKQGGWGSGSRSSRRYCVVARTRLENPRLHIWP